MTRLNISVDRKCQGHGNCYAVAPDVFAPDDEGFSTVIAASVEDGSDLAGQARNAADGCPEWAINVSSS
jgi:ferredoxin